VPCVTEHAYAKSSMSCIKRRRVSVGYSTLSVAGRDKDILIPASTPAAAALSAPMGQSVALLSGGD